MAADANRRIRVTAATQRNEAACRKTSVSVRAIDSSTRPIKEGSQLAPGADSEQSANGSRANRAMAGNNGKDEEARKGASRWSARKSCGSRKKSQKPFLGKKRREGLSGASRWSAVKDFSGKRKTRGRAGGERCASRWSAKENIGEETRKNRFIA